MENILVPWIFDATINEYNAWQRTKHSVRPQVISTPADVQFSRGGRLLWLQRGAVWHKHLPLVGLGRLQMNVG
jgi:hypothetical protein